MGNGKFWTIIAVTLSFALVGCFQNLAPDVKVPRVTNEELMSMLDRPDVIIVDVRLEDEWKKSAWKIKGAVREDPEKGIQSWADKYEKQKNLVFYCS
jgi:predicted sulfurtransferase